MSDVKAFIVALQFLTRFHLSNRVEVTVEDLGRSVGYFPLVGVVVGFFLAGISILAGEFMPTGFFAVLLILLEIVITGGLHCDGLMDTMDGIFSGRSPARMLEIMKDSRVGAYGVMGFGVFLLAKWSLLTELLRYEAAPALFMMPVLGRFAAATAICLFPYRRSEGLGKAFAEYAGPGTLCTALAWTLIFTVPFGWAGICCMAVAGGVALALARYVHGLLGGLTGDTYGFIIELTEVAVLIASLFAHPNISYTM